tara:strand:- start:442 stop:549 length:108 start_codon:yes stop_codon:yes gene_type:complete
VLFTNCAKSLEFLESVLNDEDWFNNIEMEKNAEYR